MIKFVKIVNETEFNSRHERTALPRFSLGEVWLNEDAIVKIQPASGYKQLLRDGRMGDDLDENHSFTSITLNNCGIMETHIVLGDTASVAAQLNKDPRMLLKG